MMNGDEVVIDICEVIEVSFCFFSFFFEVVLICGGKVYFGILGKVVFKENS